jgi:pimeloyl-ACP methyl ester carboxylesterase
VQVPEIRYARSGDVSVAFQVFGAGTFDLVVIRGSLSDLASVWEQPLFVNHIEGLASFARVIMFDKRGMGLSDRLRERAHARGSDGRCPGRDGCGRFRARRAIRGA